MNIVYSTFQHRSQCAKLGSDDIHIWCTSLDQSVPQIEKLSQKLSQREHKRAEQFHFAKDRQRFVISHGILRTLLGYYLKIESSKVEYRYGKRGKPMLTQSPCKSTIFFNLSRSEDLALYAFTRGNEIGVDIEYIRDFSEMNQVIEQFFSRKENELFSELPKNIKREAFFNCWTRKEAFVKALGEGLYLSLDKFDVSPAPGEPVELLRVEGCPGEVSKWSIRELNPAYGFAAAFAVKKRNMHLHCYQWSNNKINNIQRAG